MTEKEQIQQFFNSMSTKAYFFNFEEWAKDVSRNNETVQKYFEIIDRLILNVYREDYIRKIDKGSKFYRARIIPVDDYKHEEKGIGYDRDRLRGYNWEESKEPPVEYCKEAQRNNPAGETALYVADDEITACAEVKSKVRQFISVAEFELSESVEVLDFSNLNFSKPFYQYNNTYGVDVRDILSTLEHYFSHPAYDEKEYVFSQKIVKHFREKGIKGFKYRSFYSSGKNYTFFDEEMKKFIWKDSRVLINYATANLFISLDRCNADDLTNIDKIETKVNENIRENMWKDARKMWHPVQC